MSIPVLSPDARAKRETFFKIVFNNVDRGYVCIAKRVAKHGAFDERFFKWPEDLMRMMDYIETSLMTHDMWFCPMTFDEPYRRKEHVDQCPTIWSDLDACPPSELLVTPTVCVESSNKRYQALWILDSPIDPAEAETISKSVAYYHANMGADKTGWDLTQLLRIPFTHNFKYDPPATVAVIAADDTVRVEQFAAYPMPDEDADLVWPFPEEFPEHRHVMTKYKNELHATVWRLIQEEPEKDWSKSLWNLEMLLAESDLSREEMFVIARESACNKYRRDGRSEKLLWKEICKAWYKVHTRQEIVHDAIPRIPELLSDEDMRAARRDLTFVEDYIDWAKTVGDAAHAYHQAGAIVCLSGVMAGAVQLPTSFGTLIPNLWFLLLADTTLTRKSTALDLATDLLIDVDDRVIMATDGSIEGLFTTLSTRPGMPSLFLRDEFSGLLEAMTKKDYYAGMAETLTKMYDGKFQKRVLRRETIEVRDPVLIIFAGGIRTKILELLRPEHISSGFLPRFILIAAQSDISRLKPLGPPSQRTLEGRDKLVNHLQTLKTYYSGVLEVTVGNRVIETKKTWEAALTPSAWALYNELEMRLLETGLRGLASDLLTPTMDRLAKSGLKVAVLIAAARMRSQVLVDEADLIKAFSYVAEWRDHALETIAGIGLSTMERGIGTIYEAIKRNPSILRSTLMRNYHLTKRDADNIFTTLEERGLITRVRSGHSERLTAEAVK